MDIPLSQIRKVTASRLLLSKQTIPHYYLTVNTCVEKLMELEIIVEINKWFLEMICSSQPNMENRLNNMCIIDDSNPHKPAVRMANLCVVSSHTVSILLLNQAIMICIFHQLYIIVLVPRNIVFT